MAEQLKEIKVLSRRHDEHAVLVEWLVEPDDTVDMGEPIATLETTKATQDIEAEHEGHVYPFAQKDESVETEQ